MTGGCGANLFRRDRHDVEVSRGEEVPTDGKVCARCRRLAAAPEHVEALRLRTVLAQARGDALDAVFDGTAPDDTDPDQTPAVLAVVATLTAHLDAHHLPHAAYLPHTYR